MVSQSVVCVPQDIIKKVVENKLVMAVKCVTSSCVVKSAISPFIGKMCIMFNLM